jgi:hypothetical protein
MSPRRGSIMSAGDLQDMFARLLSGHLEFILGCPALNASDCCTGTEPVMHRLAIESNGDFNVTTAMHVKFDARRRERLPRTAV